MQDSSGSAADSDKKLIPDVPSEVMTKGIREEWVRKTKRALTTDQETVRAGGVPAKLKAETVGFDLLRLGPRPPDSAVQAQLNWDLKKAQYEADNDVKTAYRADKIAEIKYGLARQLEAAHERNARLTWSKMVKDPINQIDPTAGTPDTRPDGFKILTTIEGVESANLSSLTTDHGRLQRRLQRRLRHRHRHVRVRRVRGRG